VAGRPNIGPACRFSHLPLYSGVIFRPCSQEPDQKPDRHYEHRSENEIVEQPLDGSEAEIVYVAGEIIENAEEITRRYANERQQNADENANNGETQKNRKRVAAKKIAEVHALVSIRRLEDQLIA
jgi:hypothetical protein